MLRLFYENVLKRPSIMFTTAVISAFAFERLLDKGIDNLFISLNRGVRLSFLNPFFL